MVLAALPVKSGLFYFLSLWGFGARQTRGHVKPECHHFGQLGNNLDQDSSNTVLEGQCPAKFGLNPDQTHLCKLIKFFRITSTGVRFPKASFANYGHKFRHYQHSTIIQYFPKSYFKRTFANSIANLRG